MIRGPILPHLRESLWAIVAARLDAIERGLELVFEGFDCSNGQIGLVDGLARDAMGAPVLVVLALDGDALLAARVLAAREFLLRVGDALATALPEANFCFGTLGRILVVGTEHSAASLDLLQRFGLPGVQICRLEPFRIAGQERFAVRWLRGAVAAVGAPADAAAEAGSTHGEHAPFCVDALGQPHWDAIRQICERIDPAVRVGGDRFSRRITWQGRVLGEVVSVGGQLRASCPGGSAIDVQDSRDVRAFADQLLRRYATYAGLARTAAPDARPAAAAVARNGRLDAGSLRASLAAARLSAEEYSALDGAGRNGAEVPGRGAVGDLHAPNSSSSAD